MAESEKILIVDDDPTMVDLLERIFQKRGYSTVSTTSPEEALELLRTDDLQIVISDVVMPEMDGLDLLQKIKHLSPATQVIVLTGHVSMTNVLTAMRRGALTCIFKPVKDPTELFAAVAQAIQHLEHWRKILRKLQTANSRSGQS